MGYSPLFLLDRSVTFVTFTASVTSKYIFKGIIVVTDVV